MKTSIFVALLSALLCAAPVLVRGHDDKANVFTTYAFPLGKSYGEWSAEWWKWHFKLPAAGHPSTSTDGTNCSVGQSGKVWFLAGTSTNEVPDNEFFTVIRESCTVPKNTALFFPVINVECSNVDPDPAFRRDKPKQMRSCAEGFIDGPNAVARDLTVEVDGKTVKNVGHYRFQSPVFQYTLPKDNIQGVDCGQADCNNAISVSDGYWLMVPPLAKGMHKIHFTGSFREPQSNNLIFGLDVTYELLAEP